MLDNRNNINELRIYIDAFKFSNLIWKICYKWDYFAKKTLGEQLVRSAYSIFTNIAEGYGRFHFKENLRFCYYAKGSFEETKNWFKKAKVRKLISQEFVSQIDDFLLSFPISLNGYIKYIKGRING